MVPIMEILQNESLIFIPRANNMLNELNLLHGKNIFFCNIG